MKISELVTESQIIDEGVLDTVARGAGAVAHGMGRIAGIPGAIKQQFHQGRARTHYAVNGPRNQAEDPAFTKELQRLQNQGNNPAEVDAKIKQLQSEIKQLQALKLQADKQPGVGGSHAQNNTASPAKHASQEPAKVEPTMDHPDAANQQQQQTPAATSDAGATPAKKRTGGKQPGVLSNTPKAVARREKTAAKKAKPTQMNVVPGGKQKAALLSPKVAAAENIQYHSRFLDILI